MSLLSPVKIKGRLAEKLKQPSFRRRFFRLRAQEEIAQQLVELRERRNLRQIDLAKTAKMKQSAISRIEQASYSSWSYKTLLRVAEALDAQLRIVFEASEDVIARYLSDEETPAARQTTPQSRSATRSTADARDKKREAKASVE
jgi:transcriptional regulator with XRE-family HTH domain